MNAPDATDEEVIHAARVACAHAFVMICPKVMAPVLESVELP